MPHKPRNPLAPIFTLIDAYKDVVGFITYDYEMRRVTEGISIPNRFVIHRDAAIKFASFAKDLLICKIIGHDLSDDSHGGPESGYVSVYCKRCGYSRYESLY